MMLTLAYSYWSHPNVDLGEYQVLFNLERSLMQIVD
jgi:hypothetical protein